MKLRWIVLLIVLCMVFGVLTMGYCKGKEEEIRQNHAVAHSIYERPVYYGGGE